MVGQRLGRKWQADLAGFRRNGKAEHQRQKFSQTLATEARLGLGLVACYNKRKQRDRSFGWWII